MKCAVICGTIAEKCDTHLAALEDQGTVARTGRLQDAGTHNAAGAHHSDLWGKEMHGPAATARAARLTAKEFGHELPRLHAFC